MQTHNKKTAGNEEQNNKTPQKFGKWKDGASNHSEKKTVWRYYLLVIEL